tara:strand:+ start:651 stop:6137 length:5487 start_codon:yes stop_codon:yes gene_type:complete
MSEILTGDITIPTMEGGDTFDLGKYGLASEDFPELVGKSEAEVIDFIIKSFEEPSSTPDPEPAPAPPPSDDNFLPALAYGADTAQAALGAGIKAVGQGLNIEGLEEYGRDLEERNLKEAEESAKQYRQIRLDDVDFGENTTDFIIQTLGETLPSMGIAAGGAALGAAAAAATPVAALTATAGGLAGAFLPSSLMGAGEVQLKMQNLVDDSDYEDPATAITGGLIIGALDTAAAAIPALKLLSKGFTQKATSEALEKSGIDFVVSKNGTATAIDELKKAGGDFAKAEANIVAGARDVSRGRLVGAGVEGTKQLAREGLTEGTQEAIGSLLAQGSTGVEDEEFLSSILESAVKGGIAGFGPGAVVGALKGGKGKNYEDLKEEEAPKIDDSAEIKTPESKTDYVEAAETQAADIENDVAPATDIGELADVMNLRNRDDQQFSESGDGTAAFLNEYADLSKEATDLRAEQELGLVSGNIKGAAKVSNNLRLRIKKLTEMNKIISTPQFQASLNKHPALKKQLDNIGLEIDARTAEIKAASVPAGIVGEADILPELTDLNDAPILETTEGGAQLPIKFQEGANIYLDNLMKAPIPEDSNLLSNLPIAQEMLALADHIKKQIPFLRVDPRTRMEFSPKRLETVYVKFDEAVKKAAPQTKFDPETKKNVDNLIEAGNAQGPRKGMDTEAPRPVNVRDNGPQGMLNRVGFYMRYMSSNKRLADKFPELRKMYNLVKRYNEKWFSIITQGIEGRSLVLALPRGELRQKYRNMRVKADLVSAPIEFPESGDIAAAGGVARINIPMIEGVEGQYDNVPDVERRRLYLKEVMPYQEYDPDSGKLNLNFTEEEIQQGFIEERDPLVVNALFQEQRTIESMWDNLIGSRIDSIKRRLKDADEKAGGKTNSTRTIEAEEDAILVERGLTRDDILTEVAEFDLFLRALERVNNTQKIKAEKEQGLNVSKEALEIMPEAISELTSSIKNRREGYFPRIRAGDFIIRAFTTITDSDGRKTRKVVYRRDVNTPYAQSLIGRFKPGTNQDQQAMNFINNKYKAPLEQFYKDKGLDVQIEVVAKGDENYSVFAESELMDMAVLESILIHEAKLNEDFSGKTVLWRGTYVDQDGNVESKPIKDTAAFIRFLAKQRRERMQGQGFGGSLMQRKNIPGYLTADNVESYHDNAWAQYVTSMGRYVAKNGVEDEVKAELDRLDKLQQRKLPGNFLEVADTMWNNTKSPQGAASALKSIAFYGFLGGNFSSSFLNLTQNFVTASLLYGAYGKLFQPKVSKAAAAAARLSIYYSRKQAFLEADRVNVVRILQQTGAARNATEANDQFNKLYELQRRGVIGRINTAALSQNADLTTEYWSDKLGLNSVENIARKGLDVENVQRFKDYARTGKKIVDGVYSTTEIANRIAAALATYNTVKAHGEQKLKGVTDEKAIINAGLEPMVEFAAETASQGEIVSIEDAMQYMVDESQFNLSAFNRPRIAFAGGGLGGIALQFIPFVTMMTEVYANAIHRYGGNKYGTIKGGVLRMTPQGRRTLAFLVLTQVLMGGMFGLPFADDMKEVIKALVRSPIGKSLGLQQSDLELAFYDIMTDHFGPEALSLSEAIARGPIKAWGGVDIAQRVSLSPFRTLIEAGTGQASVTELFTGPAGSFFTNSIGKSYDAFERGDLGKGILRLIPLAIVQNMINAWEAGETGVFSGKGRLLTDSLQPHDLALMTLGFSTENVFLPRQRLYREKNLLTKSNAIKDFYLDKVLRLMVRQKNVDSSEEKAELGAQIEKLFKEVLEHDLKQEQMSDMIDPNFNIRNTAHKRYVDQVLGLGKYTGGIEALQTRQKEGLVD